MKWFFFGCCAAATWILSATVLATEAYSNPEWTGSAIDFKGMRHEAQSYPGSQPPWARDQINAVGPEYPYADRRQQHEGRGFFQLTLDLKSGAVVKVAVIKSTGFDTLDRSDAAALRQWRWRPGKWKEITMPVTFTMSPKAGAISKDARVLPPVRY